MSKKNLIIIQKIMTKKIVSVFPDTPLFEAMQKLARYKYNGLPVVDNENRIAGILTEYELMSNKVINRISSLKIIIQDLHLLKKYHSRVQEDISRIFSLRVKDIMNPTPLTLDENASLEEAIKAFRSHHRVNPIPIIDSDRKVVGIISRSDILKSFRTLSIIKNLFLGYKTFLRKSIFSSPDDIERPYHKIINLALKILGIGFAAVGVWLLYKSVLLYVVEIKNSSAVVILEQNQSLNQVIALSLLGIGSVLIGIFISLVLLLRYISFTLPDRIYLRQSAFKENEQKR